MHDEDHHNGLLHDVRGMSKGMSRRQILRLLAGASLLPLAASCASDGSTVDNSGTDDESGSGGASDGTCTTIPTETAGPYPGDGTNGANALALAGIVRSDIRSSIGSASGAAEGVPLTIKLTLVNSKGSCERLAGYAVYLWHCDREGNYSMYSSSVATTRSRNPSPPDRA